MFTVTNEWIEKWTTLKGGWLNRQLAIIGAKFTDRGYPIAGWKRAAVGMVITEQQSREFEILSGKTGETLVRDPQPVLFE